MKTHTTNNRKRGEEKMFSDIRGLIEEMMGYGDIRVDIEEDVAEVITTLTDKRRVKKMKKLLREFDMFLMKEKRKEE